MVHKYSLSVQSDGEVVRLVDSSGFVAATFSDDGPNVVATYDKVNKDRIFGDLSLPTLLSHLERIKYEVLDESLN